MKEALTMVYALHKFKHYLLGNHFIFYVDHMALVYLINKPQVSSIIARWILLVFEYDFKIVHKLGRSHLMVDALNKLPNKTKLIGVPNQTTDAHMFIFTTKMVTKCLWLLVKGDDAITIYYFIKTIFSSKS